MKTFELTSTKAYRIDETEYKGCKLLMIGKMWKKKDDKEWQHSKSNISFSINNNEEIDNALRVAKFLVKKLEGLKHE